VSVGDIWDASANLSRDANLGKDDHIIAKCILDWVKDIDGKKMGQITCVIGEIDHEADNVEEDSQNSNTLLVDINAGQILKGDQIGSTKIFSTKNAPDRPTTTIEYKYHCEGQTISRASTQP
jgi:hypothetical protein